MQYILIRIILTLGRNGTNLDGSAQIKNFSYKTRQKHLFMWMQHKVGSIEETSNFRRIFVAATGGTITTCGN